MLMVAVMAIALANRNPARAQCPTCTYHVAVTCDVPAECFPLKLTTGWHCLNPIDALTITIDACGDGFLPMPGPCKPVPCDLIWASLDGGTTAALPNGPPVKYLCTEGVIICLTLVQRPGDCPIILVSSC